MPRVSLRISIVMFALFTVALTAIAVHTPWYFASRANVSDMAQQLSNEIVAGISREVEGIFSSAIAAQDAIAGILQEGMIDIDDRDAREKLFKSFLLANRHFSWVSYGRPNGDFYGAQRRDEVNLRLVESHWREDLKTAERREQYLVNDGERISPTVVRTKLDDYFAPQRSWYKLAITNRGPVWTDVYVFSASNRPGLNAAIADYRDDVLQGVISVAIELDRISRYLATVRSVRSGAAFIVDTQSRVIAFQDPHEVTRPGRSAEEPELRLLAETGHPMLKIATAALHNRSLSLAEIKQPTHTVFQRAEDGARFFVSVAPLGTKDWLVGTVIPEAEFTGPVERNTARLALAVLAALVLVCLIAVVTSRSLFVVPLRKIIEQTALISQFQVDEVERVASPIREIDILSCSIEKMSSGLRSFQRYLPADLVRLLLSQGLVAQLGGQRRTLTILFMDLEGFSALSERMGHRVVPVLGHYLSAMSRVITDERGTIDKYIGDAIMAFWGAPTEDDDQAFDACRAALQCSRMMQTMHAGNEFQEAPNLKVRIGINTGRVVVGNMGSDTRLNYTAIGDPVNVASRVEGLSKNYGTEILITQHTYELVKYDVVARRIDLVQVRGREERTALYELLAIRADSGEVEGYEWIAEFEAALSLYEAGQWDAAIARFRATIAMRGEDSPSCLYIQRCEERLAAGGQVLALRLGGARTETAS